MVGIYADAVDRLGNRVATYIAVAVAIVVGIAWSFSILEGRGCVESDTGRCDVSIEFLIVTVVVLGTVVPCEVFFGEMWARDRRRRAASRGRD